MTREDVTKLFSGVEITDDQITALLNLNNSEVVRERNKASKYKDDAAKVKDLQSRIDELENANLSDIDKANRERDDALESVKTLEAEVKKMTLKNGLAERGITGEQANKLVDSILSGEFDTSVLGDIISEKEMAAASAKEQEILKNTGSPGGQGGTGNNVDDKPSDVKNAEGITFGRVGDKANETQNYYK